MAFPLPHLLTDLSHLPTLRTHTKLKIIVCQQKKKKSPNIALNLFCADHLCLGTGPALKYGFGETILVH